MAKNLIGYRAAFDKAWRPYWRKWLATKPLRCKTGIYRAEGVPDVRIITYAQAWVESDAPEPDELAAELNRILGWLVATPAAVLGYWPKEELAGVHWGSRRDVIPEPPSPSENAKLIVRIPWELHVSFDFNRFEDHVGVRGRFGVLWHE